jgi:type I restriction enzyme, S subunit
MSGGNWVETTIGEVYNFVGGGTPSKNVPRYWDGDIPWASIKDISQVKRLRTTKDHISEEGLSNSAANIADAGEVILGTRMLPGKVLISEIRTAINQDLKIVRPKVDILTAFTVYQFEFLQNEFLSRAGGTTVMGITIEKIKEVPFLLPSLSEQKRIVAKLDVLFAHLDQLKTRLENIPALLKQFRQAVLTQAVTGKLTEEWRKKKNISFKWKKEKTTECCEVVQSGGTPKEGFTTSGVPFLKVYNIVNQKVDFFYKPQFISEGIHERSQKKSITRPGDVLMNIVGPPLGKIALVPHDFSEWNINQAITLFRPKDRLSNKFLYYFFCEGTIIRDIINETRGMVGQSNISLSQCRNFEIDLPSIGEQTEIVRRIESLFTVAERIETSYVKLLEKIDSLPKSILSQAFRGELVSERYDEDLNNAVLMVAEAESVLSKEKYSAKRSR